MWWTIVFFVAFFNAVHSNVTVPNAFPRILTAFGFGYGSKDKCQMNLYTLDVGELTQNLDQPWEEPATNFAHRYMWEIPCFSKYTFSTFAMMKHSNNKFYLTGCFFRYEPNQKMICVVLKEHGKWELGLLDINIFCMPFFSSQCPLQWSPLEGCYKIQLLHPDRRRNWSRHHLLGKHIS